MDLSYTYNTHTLENGLEVVTVELPHVHATEVAFYIRAGSRFETKKANGITHFLEHLLFRGTESTPGSRAFNHEFEVLGDGLNANTFREFTCFWSRINPKNLERCFDLFSQMWTAPLLDHLETEKNIITEEIREDFGDDGSDLDLDNLSKKLLFPTHPMGFPIIGNIKNVTSFTQRQVNTHFKKFYCAKNMLVSIVGPIQTNKTQELTKKYFGNLQEGKRAKPTPKARFPKIPKWKQSKGPRTSAEIQMTFKGIPENHKDIYKLTMIQRLLDDGISSRLQYEIVEKRGLAYNITANIDCFSDFGLFDICFNTAPKKVMPTIEVITDILKELKTNPIPEKEFTRTKERCQHDALFMLDSPRQMSIQFAETALFNAPFTPENVLEAFEEMKPEDTIPLAKKLFQKQNLQIVSSGPTNMIHKRRISL